MPGASRICLAAFTLGSLAAAADAQVRVETRPQKDGDLAGEPVVVLVDVINIGDESVAYATGGDRVRLTVHGLEERRSPSIFGCDGGYGWGVGGGALSHPP